MSTETDSDRLDSDQQLITHPNLSGNSVLEQVRAEESTTSESDVEAQIKETIRKYGPGTGNNRYARFADDFLGVVRTYVLDTILEALDEHRQVVAIGGNGVGKSFFVGVGGLAALYTNSNTIVHVTAGNSGTLKNNIWKPTRGLFKDTKRRWGDQFPGRTLDGTREIQTGIAEKWYFECVSPRYPDDLEGPHNDHVIYFIEEADKPAVTAEHIDSVRSTVTDAGDRVCVVANPPTDDGNVVSGLIESDEWHTIYLPSWESHNVRRERGLDDDTEYIGGLATSWKIQQDWDEYHNEPWPGLEQAIEWSLPFLTSSGEPTPDPNHAVQRNGRPEPNPAFREDLHTQWYKRRAGIRPPQNSETWRPFSVGDVRAAFKRDHPPSVTIPFVPSSVGIDIARSGDKTVLSGVHTRAIKMHYSRQGTDHPTQRERLKTILSGWEPVPNIAVDTPGVGGPMTDDLDALFPNVTEFNNGGGAVEGTSYHHQWEEGLFHLGQFLRDGGSFTSPELRRELLAAARTIEFSERFLKSRGRDGATVVTATKKEKIKDALGHSPDHLDAAIMAVWRERIVPIRKPNLSTGGDVHLNF